MKAILAAMFLVLPLVCTAQAWPSKPVRMIVPYAPGGVLDGFVRPLAQRLGEALGQPIVVENRPGANTAIGTGLCATGAPDGHLVCISGTGVVLNPLLYKSMQYDPVKDLAPVSHMVSLDSVIVAHAAMPFTNLAGLIAYARANPGKLNFGSFGDGSAAHLYLEWIKDRAKIDIVHVPYKGTAPLIQALLANEVQVSSIAPGIILGHLRAGRMKPIVAPAPARLAALPQVPTMREEGFDFKPTSWFGLFAPAATPQPVIARLHAELRKVLLEPKFREEVIERQLFVAVASSPEEFAEFLKSEREIAAHLVRISGLKPFE
jgi:tripartite-type tricarboxylate transporter receptor subunit TctC